MDVRNQKHSQIYIYILKKMGNILYPIPMQAKWINLDNIHKHDLFQTRQIVWVFPNVYLLNIHSFMNVHSQHFKSQIWISESPVQRFCQSEFEDLGIYTYFNQCSEWSSNLTQ